jgi:hypothetical protein
MEKQLAEGKIGEVGQYDLDFTAEGNLRIQVSASHGLGSAGIVLELKGEAVLDALAAAIPGKVDDAVIGLMKAALLGK